MKSADSSLRELRVIFPESHFFLCSPAEIVEWLRSVEGLNLAFGFLYYPEYKSFAGVYCRPSQVVATHLPQDEMPQTGFVAFPFDGATGQGFFLNHEANLDLGSLEAKSEHSPSLPLFKEGQKSDYEDIVAQGVESIRNHELQKLVLARMETLENKGKSLVDWVQFLLAEYPEAHITFFQIPGEGIWISATPELLLERNPVSGHLKTMALAGTSGTESVPTWTPKEKEEQAFVGDFIKSAIQHCGLTLLEENGPYPISAGKLHHLKTDFVVAPGGVHSFRELAYALHPTPAVGGTPREKAMAAIKALEGFERSFYGGFAGLIGFQQARLVVLLRCGKMVGNRITLFAGAGITADSDPAKEWMETVRKMDTLKRFLN